jgi:hypothetical protein
VQIAGVSYDNLGEAGLEFLSQMANGGGQARVLTTLNPAGMDVENWQAMGISPEFAAQQERVIEAFGQHGRHHHLHLHPLPDRQPAALWRAHRLGREQRRLLCQLSAGGAHQPRGRPQRAGCRPDRFHPGLRLHLDENRRQPSPSRSWHS